MTVGLTDRRIIDTLYRMHKKKAGENKKTKSMEVALNKNQTEIRKKRYVNNHKLCCLKISFSFVVMFF